MTLFEFILVMVSLILAIGVTHLLKGVAEIARYRETLKFDWVPLAWAASLFVLSAAHWWSLWDFRGVDWTFPDFFFVLLPPTLLYVAVRLLVSGEVRKSGASMAAGFERVRTPFMAVMVVLSVLVTFDGWVLGVEPIWNSLRMSQVVAFGIIFMGLVSSRRSLQCFVAAAMLVIYLFGAFVLRFLPGAFGPS